MPTFFDGVLVNSRVRNKKITSDELEEYGRRQSWFTLGFRPGIRLERDGEKMKSPRKLVNEV